MPRRGNQLFGSQRSSIEVSDVLCQLLKQQSAPDVNIDVFDDNSLNFKYFMTLFREVVESEIKDPRGRFTRGKLSYQIYNWRNKRVNQTLY